MKNVQTKSKPVRRSGGDPTVAVAFGGGGARGIAHIHIIETLNEMGIQPVVVSGSSIGAIMAAGMASGMSGADIREYALATIGSRAEVLTRFWRSRPSSVKDAWTGGFRLGQFNIERVLKAFLPEAIPHDFADLKIPAKIIATDYYAQTEVVLEEGELYSAIAASASIPAVFRPVRRNGRIMIDGGIYNPVPYDHLRGLADIVIGVEVVGGPTGNKNTVPTTFDSMFGATQLMMQSIIALKLKDWQPDIFLRPSVSRFRVLEFLKAEAILEESEGVRDELKRQLETAMDAHIKAG